MKDFIKRNSPVLIIGLVLLLTFLVIIAISTTKKQYSPTLKKISEEIRETQIDSTVSTSQEKTTSLVPPVILPITTTAPTTLKVTTNPVPVTATPEETAILKALEEDKIKQALPKEVTYTKEKGFDPEFLVVSKDQVISWINKSQDNISIYESSISYPELKEPKVIRPGEKLTFSPYKPRLFVISITENEDQKSAIFVNENGK